MAGDWDEYCAICGGPLHVLTDWEPVAELEESDSEDGQRPEYLRGTSSMRYDGSYDPAVLMPDDPKLQWLSRFRVIKEIPPEYSTGRKESVPAEETSQRLKRQLC